MPPSARQQQALRFLRDQIRLHGRSPTELDVALHLRITQAAAHVLILRMERAGLVRRTPGMPRSLVPQADDARLEREAKGIVLVAFRNGPIEDVHAGKKCDACDGKKEYSHITDDEMKTIMKTAVDRVFTLLAMRDEQPAAYERMLQFASLQTRRWDPPVRTTDF